MTSIHNIKFFKIKSSFFGDVYEARPCDLGGNEVDDYNSNIKKIPYSVIKKLYSHVKGFGLNVEIIEDSYGFSCFNKVHVTVRNNADKALFTTINAGVLAVEEPDISPLPLTKL